MLGRALAEIKCLKTRGEADRAVLKAHQSREFYAEEQAAQLDACRMQLAGVVTKVRPGHAVPWFTVTRHSS